MQNQFNLNFLVYVILIRIFWELCVIKLINWIRFTYSQEALNQKVNCAYRAFPIKHYTQITSLIVSILLLMTLNQINELARLDFPQIALSFY